MFPVHRAHTDIDSRSSIFKNFFLPGGIFFIFPVGHSLKLWGQAGFLGPPGPKFFALFQAALRRELSSAAAAAAAADPGPPIFRLTR